MLKNAVFHFVFIFMREKIYNYYNKEMCYDFQRAFHYFTMAAESGNSNAYAFLGKVMS